MKCKIAILILGVLFQSAIAINYVNIDDGEYHLINDATYQDSSVILDYNIANNPGTHFNIVNGGNIWHLGACNNSTIKVDGGIVSYGISMSNNSELEVNAGTIGTIWSSDQSSVTVNGGTLNDYIHSYDNSTVDIYGGMFADLSKLIASGSSIMYLYGDSFSVNGIELDYGDSLRDYGVTYPENELRGIITGTLSDGSLLNCEFILPINNPGGADIIVIPEPFTGILLAAGVLFLRRRR